MSWPPFFLSFRVGGPRRRFGCWIPLVLIWFPLLVLGLAVALPVFVASIVLWPTRFGRRLLLGGLAFYRLLAALRGVTVDVQGRRESVYISFW